MAKAKEEKIIVRSNDIGPLDEDLRKKLFPTNPPKTMRELMAAKNHKKRNEKN